MTQEELIRFNRGNDLFDQIERIKAQIDNIKHTFDRHYYPRAESGWKLSGIFNDSFENINLSSEEFWKCIDTILYIKNKKLEQLQQEFDKL